MTNPAAVVQRRDMGDPEVLKSDQRDVRDGRHQESPHGSSSRRRGGKGVKHYRTSRPIACGR